MTTPATGREAPLGSGYSTRTPAVHNVQLKTPPALFVRSTVRGSRVGASNRQRRMDGIEPLVLALSAKGPTHGEISAHFAEVYRASVPRTPSPGSPTPCWSRWRSGRTGHWTRCARCCSSTPCSSRSATVRSPTGRSTPWSESPSTVNATFSGCGDRCSSRACPPWPAVASSGISAQHVAGVPSPR